MREKSQKAYWGKKLINRTLFTPDIHTPMLFHRIVHKAYTCGKRYSPHFGASSQFWHFGCGF